MTPAPAAPGYSLVSLGAVDSTNREARARAEAGAPHATVVWAREQTAGRGRHGRSWASPPGNLYLSILLRPDCPPAAAAQTGFVAGAAMAQAIAAQGAAAVSLKWPNDILCEGRKLSGILVESASDGAGRLAWAVVGVGVNVAHHPADLPDAADLAGEGVDVDVEALRDAFLARFFALYRAWREQGFEPVRAAWLQRAHTMGQRLSVRLPDGPVAGDFAGIDATGNLLLATGEGTRRITVGDVFPLAEPATGE